MGYTRELLSASTQGRGIKVVATATAGTLIHTTGTSATAKDEVWLYAYNGHTSTVELTLEIGGATVPDDNIVLSIPAVTGLTLVIPGLTYTGDGTTGLSINAFADVANVVVLSGYVNRAA